MEGPPAGKKRKLSDSQSLPFEMWTKVFEYLPSWQLQRVRLVCHRWKDIVDGSSVLKANFKVSFPNQIIMDREYKPDNLFPAASMAFLRQVRIAAVGSWWVPFGQGLTELELEGCKIMLANLLIMLKHAPNLKYLNLSNVVVETFEANPVVDFRMERLEKFAIDYVNRAENLAVFGAFCPKLRYLKIFIDDSFEDQLALLEHVVKLIRIQHGNLDHLEIGGDELLFEELVKLQQWKLKGLIVRGYYDVENVSVLIDFCRMLPSLEILHVEPTTAASEINQIAQLLPNLKRLKMTLKSIALIQPTFLSQFTNLQSLSFENFEVDELSIDFDGIECFNLNTLELDGAHLFGLQKFLAKCPKLRSLRLEACKFSSWAEIFRAVGTCKRLQKLSILGIDAISDEKCFIDYLDDMRFLKLRDCNIPQEMLSTLLNLCPRLESLRVGVMRNALDDEIRRVICWKLHHLVEVKIDFCALSEQAISFMKQNCRVQKSLEITKNL